MWINKHILYQTLCCAPATLSVCLCSTCRAHACTRLLADLKSAALTPGVSVESHWVALPLTEICTCCLSAASARFIFLTEINQAVTSHRQLYHVFERTPTVHIKCMHSHSHIHKNKQKFENNTQAPAWCFLMANKVQRQRGIIWQKEGMWQCVFGGLVLLTPASEAALLKLTLKARAEQ